jgi:hypothetical protein
MVVLVIIQILVLISTVQFVREIRLQNAECPSGLRIHNSLVLLASSRARWAGFYYYYWATSLWASLPDGLDGEPTTEHAH